MLMPSEGMGVEAEAVDNSNGRWRVWKVKHDERRVANGCILLLFFFLDVVEQSMLMPSRSCGDGFSMGSSRPPPISSSG